MEIDPLTLVLPGVLLGGFGLAAARNRASWSVSLRVLGGVRVSRGAPQTCPHLGLADDPFSHREEPFEEHRCYLYMQRSRVDLTHQKGFCHSTAHTACPWLSIRPDTAPAPLAGRLAEGGRKVAEAAGPAARRGVAASAMAASVAAERTGQAAGGAWRWTRGVAAPRLRSGTAAVLTQTGAALQVCRDLLADGLALCARLIAAGAARAGELLAGLAAWAGTGFASSLAVWLGALRRMRLALSAAAAARRSKAAAARTAPASLAAGASPAGAAPVAAIHFEESAPAQAATAAPPQVSDLPAPAAPPAIATEVPSPAAPGVTPAQPAAPARRAAFTPRPVVVPLLHLANRSAAGTLGASAAPRSAAQVLELGLAALETGNEEEAYRQFVAATEADPGHSRAWYWRAKTAPTLSELARCLGRALDADPANEQIRSNYQWAVQRLDLEQQRTRLVRVAAAPLAAAAPAAETRRSKFGAAVGGVVRAAAGVACLALAGLWVAASVVAIAPEAGGALPPGLRPVLPNLSLALANGPELLPGYRLLAGLPHTLAFLALFAGIGIMQRQRWARPWALVVALIHLWVTLSGAGDDTGQALALALTAAVAAGVVLGGAGVRDAPVAPLIPQRRV